LPTRAQITQFGTQPRRLADGARQPISAAMRSLWRYAALVTVV
jgi:hypothetical protein